MEGSVNPLVDMFEEAEQANIDANDLALRCRDYYNGDQLTAEEITELQKRGQPIQISNYIRSTVNWMLGLEVQTRTDPQAFPREPNAEQGAEAATDALRYVCDNTNWAKKKSKCWGDLLVEGTCGIEVIHRFQPPMREPEIVLNRYPFDRIFYDPHSTEDDFSDARYKGVVVWSDMDDLIRQYPDKEDIIEGSIGPNDVSTDLYEDKPYYTVWTDPKRRRARCVLIHFKKEGQWHWAKFVKGGVLEEGISPYLDEDGQPECPLILQSLYVGRDNDRHGFVKDKLYPQDGINKRESKLLHMANSRQTWGPKGAVDSVKAMKRELARPDGHVEVSEEAAMNARETGVLPFNIIPTSDQTVGQFNLLQEAKGEMNRQGANGALSGRNPQGTSGRAIMAEQQGGMVENAPLTDALAHFTQQVYRQMWNRVRQFWTEQKWIRVTDDERNTRFVGLNQPTTLQDELSQLPQEQVYQIARQMGLTPNDPRLQQVVGVQNQVSEIDVDIVLDEAPDAITLEGETFEQLVNLATSMPGAVPPQILIESAPNLSRDMKDKLLEAMEQQQAQGQQAQGQAMEMETAERSAAIQKDNAQAMKYVADANKTQAEALLPQAI